MKKFGLEFKPHIHIIEPVGYMEMLVLQSFSKFVITDSGGIQKEAFFAEKPCITLRNQTEWVETVNTGWNRLVGSDADLINQSIKGIAPLKSQPNLFGQGNSSIQILDQLSTF